MGRGASRCARHQELAGTWLAAPGTAPGDVPGRTAGSAGVLEEDGREPGRERRDLTETSYRELLGPNLTTLVADAATAPPLTDEIGMLRVTLARLLVEEADVARLAANVARVAAVAVQAARVRGVLGGQDDESDAAAAVRATLLLIGKGELAAAARGEEPEP